MIRGPLAIVVLGAAALTAAPFFTFTKDVSASLLLPAAPASAAQQPSKSSAGKTSTGSVSKAPAKYTKKKPTRRVRRARGQQAPTPERIKEIQQTLARQGHYQGEPTGKWDAATIEALKSFQQANGLTPTGKLDARTLQKLGLGSEVAGQAPPRPSAAAERADPPRP